MKRFFLRYLRLCKAIDHKIVSFTADIWQDMSVKGCKIQALSYCLLEKTYLKKLIRSTGCRLLKDRPFSTVKKLGKIVPMDVRA